MADNDGVAEGPRKNSVALPGRGAFGIALNAASASMLKIARASLAADMLQQLSQIVRTQGFAERACWVPYGPE